jgi:hypothetical protein
MLKAARLGVFSGERNGRSNLHEWEAVLIRVLYDLGMVPTSFAWRFPVKQRQCYNIGQRGSCAHAGSLPDLLRGLPGKDIKIIRKAVEVFEGGLALYNRKGWRVKPSFLELLEGCRAMLAEKQNW